MPSEGFFCGKQMLARVVLFGWTEFSSKTIPNSVYTTPALTPQQLLSVRDREYVAEYPGDFHTYV
jgi:hypothetical protein